MIDSDFLPKAEEHAHAAWKMLDISATQVGFGFGWRDVVTGAGEWSQQLKMLFGLDPAGPTPTRDEFLALVDDADRERVLHELARPMAAGEVRVFEYGMCRRGDGHRRTLQTRGVAQMGSQGRPTLWYAAVTDDTEARANARRQAELLERLQLCTEASGIGTWERDLRTGVGHWNRTLYEINRQPWQEAAPSQDEIVRRVDTPDREVVRAAWRRMIDSDAVVEYEHRIRRGDGSTGFLLSRGRAQRDATGRAVKLYGSTIDVTEWRRTLADLGDAQEHLRLASEAAGIGTWQRDILTGEGWWDATTLGLFGLPAGGPPPSHEQFRALVHPGDRAGMPDDWAPLGDETSAVEFQYRVLLPDGRVRWLCTRGRSEYDASHRLVRRMGICFDTTERHAAESALQAKEVAERANAAKTEFLSRMSHELRTPLNAVLGFAQLMALDHTDPLPAAQRARVAHIQAAGWHLLALINDVLDLARIESGQTQLNMALLPLAAVIEECVAMNAAAAAGRDIAIRFACDAATPAVVWADSTRLKQVLVNLLSNAVKYNRDGGRVDIEARLRNPAQVQIVVRDTGLGMAPGQLAQLFQPFNRLGRESTAVEGTGIGLALSKLLVEQMGGRLEARSQPALGSEFWLTLGTACEASHGPSSSPSSNA